MAGQYAASSMINMGGPETGPPKPPTLRDPAEPGRSATADS
jgi:hypothetical protein